MSTGGTFDITNCLKRVQGQDEEAARQLVAHVHPLLIRIVRSHRPVRMAEEDLLQEILVKMFQKLEQYEVREGAPFEHWLSRVAVRTCLDALRAEKRRPETRWEDLSEGELRWLEFMAGEFFVVMFWFNTFSAVFTACLSLAACVPRGEAAVFKGNAGHSRMGRRVNGR